MHQSVPSLLARTFASKRQSIYSAFVFEALPSVRHARTHRDVDVNVTKFRGCGKGGTFEVESWTLSGVDHFMEEPTSRAMFAAAVRWLMPKTRAGAEESR